MDTGRLRCLKNRALLAGRDYASLFPALDRRWIAMPQCPSHRMQTAEPADYLRNRIHRYAIYVFVVRDATWKTYGGFPILRLWRLTSPL